MKLKSILPLFVTASMLGGIVLFGRSAENIAEANEYHLRIEAAVKSIPTKIGDWEGVDMELPPEAVALLKPNAVCSRHYVNRKSGVSAVLLLIQCRTARDMLGHYPPVCYKSNGFQMRSSEEQVWHAEDLDVEAMEYEFFQAFPTRMETVVVGNVLILPDGRFVRDMDTIRSMAGDHVKQAFGAAQMQLRVSSKIELLPEQRSAIYEEFLGEIRDVIRAIATGVES